MAGKRKILVVDDDRLVLATVTHGLAEAGYEVIDADNGDDAIALARTEHPDLALLDIRMQGMSGFDVAAYLREHCGTPFMFLSAFCDDATAEQVNALGAVAYLTKPLDVGQIVPRVAAAFDALPRRADAPCGAAAASVIPGSADPSATSCPPLDDARSLIALAVGVLMAREALPRTQALQRLQRDAAQSGRTLPEQAALTVEAVERSVATGCTQ